MGFIAGAKDYAAKLAAGGSAADMKVWAAQKLNMQIDTAVTAFFLACVAIIFLGCLREWIKLIRGTKTIELHEDPYVALPESA